MRRALQGIGLVIALGLAVLAELYFVQGMRIVMTGNMQYKGISWGSERRKHDDEIEASRARQRAQASASPSASVEASIAPGGAPVAAPAAPPDMKSGKARAISSAIKPAPASYWT